MFGFEYTNPKRKRGHLRLLDRLPRLRVELVLVLALCGCGASAHTTSSPQSSDDLTSSSRLLQLIISGDTRGWFVPCGCTANQSGGLLRRANYILQQRHSHDVVVLDAGGAASGQSTYDLLRFSAIVNGERAMGLEFHNLGGPELNFGPVKIRSAMEKTQVPFFSANTTDVEGKPLAPASKHIDQDGGLKLLVVGVASPSCATAEVRVSDPAEAVLREWQPFRGSKALLVVLAWMPEAELRELARQLPEADAIVGSFMGQAMDPERIGRTWVACAANKGKFIVEISFSGNDSYGRVVEMTAGYADDAQQLEILKIFRDELAQRDLPATLTSFVSESARQTPDDVRVAGSEACRSCHQAEWDAWQSSGHAHAWQTLSDQGAHVDAACQVCHTTGFGLPNGFVSAKRSASRVDVGCESCHGPSERHSRDAAVRTPFRAADQCANCHDLENSPQFEYSEYWNRIRHGERKTQEVP